MFRWDRGSFSVTFHRETLNMAWTSNNYKYVQSLMSGFSHPQQRITYCPVISEQSLCWQKSGVKKGRRTSGAVCVSVCFCLNVWNVQYVFVGLCLCAFANGDVCSVWATLKTVWAQMFWLLWCFSFIGVHPEKKKKKKAFEWHFSSGKYPCGPFVKMWNTRSRHYQNIHKPQRRLNNT